MKAVTSRHCDTKSDKQHDLSLMPTTAHTDTHTNIWTDKLIAQ